MKNKVRTYLLKLFMKEDAPARLAVGFALGAITNFYPTFGFGLPLTIALAVITRTSIIGSIVGENLFKILYPITLYLSFLVGSLLFPLSNQTLNMHSILRMCTSWHGFSRSWHIFAPYAKSFFAGALINSVVFGAVLTLVIYVLLVRHRHTILQHLTKREEDNF
ncbi:MAG: DUF2062 domain-containing protein [Ignavibacteriales bacterium]